MSEAPCELEIVSWTENSLLLSDIRRKVFIEEQNVSEAEEWDEQDAHEETQHFMISKNDQAVGCARLLANGQIGRMAIRKGFREQGFGLELLRGIIRHSLQQQFASHTEKDLFLHAQVAAIPFYKKMGFHEIGNHFMDAGIPHKTMVLELDSSTLTTLYRDRVWRLQQAHEFSQHLVQTIRFGNLNLNIFCHHLTPSLWAHPEAVKAISALARRSAHSRIRILLQDAKAITGKHHPVVVLCQRISSRMEIKVLDKDVGNFDNAYAIIDEKQLVYLNSEDTCTGFANYQAAAESQHLREEFDRIWLYSSHSDQDLAQLYL
ncbi:GNAT family N-acetyltransferase [Teredinibacter haidensis]|uniref:GNAT family N-acetyltransferase n=1 Tax=Teredinibacter haidensis TaxID=2731755 RepID=UPI000948D5F2|nr:GNAT family N-acetyltransferase [Teredinibacter haidensis]